MEPVAGARHRLTASLVVATGLLVMSGALALDPVLPALPAIAEHFGGGASQAQLVLSGTMLGIAAGQLVVGSLSDALGRRPVVLAGIVLYAIVSVVASLAPTLEALVAVRFVQGIAASTGIVLSRAVLADLFAGRDSVRAFGWLTTMQGLAPVLAPMMGALLLEAGGWRVVLLGIAAIAVVTFAMVALFVPESLPPERRVPLRFADSLRSYALLLRSRAFLGFSAAIISTHATVVLYLGSSSFIVQNVLGFTPLGYAIVFAIGSTGMVLGGLLSSRIAVRFERTTVLWAAQSAALAAHVVLLVVTLAGALNVVVFTCWVLVLMGSLALVLSVGIGLALEQAAGFVGAGAALFGAVQYVVASLVVPVGGLWGADTAVPLAVGAIVLGVAGIVIRALLVPRARMR